MEILRSSGDYQDEQKECGEMSNLGIILNPDDQDLNLKSCGFSEDYSIPDTKPEAVQNGKTVAQGYPWMGENCFNTILEKN